MTRAVVTGDELVAFLGHSIRSKPLRSAMATLKLRSPKPRRDSQGDKYDSVTSTRKQDISLVFDGYRRYAREYGEPVYVADKTKDEFVLRSIGFTGQRALPFGLAPDDRGPTVIAQLGGKPRDKSHTAYGQAWWFSFEAYQVLVAVDERERMMWLHVL